MGQMSKKGKWSEIAVNVKEVTDVNMGQYVNKKVPGPMGPGTI